MSFKNGIHVSNSLTRHFTCVILQQCCFLSVSELFYFNDSYIIPNNFMPLYADCVNKSVSSVENRTLKTFQSHTKIYCDHKNMDDKIETY